jgi:hypothetical protein
MSPDEDTRACPNRRTLGQLPDLIAPLCVERVEGDGWSSDFPKRMWVEEAEQRKLSAKDCKVLLVARGAEPAEETQASKTDSTDLRRFFQSIIGGACFNQSRAERSFAKYNDDVISDFCACLAKKVVSSISDTQLVTSPSLTMPKRNNIYLNRRMLLAGFRLLKAASANTSNWDIPNRPPPRRPLRRKRKTARSHNATNPSRKKSRLSRWASTFVWNGRYSEIWREYRP